MSSLTRCRPARVAVTAPLLAVLALAGCSTVDDAAQGVQSVASSRAAGAVDDAKSKASQIAADAVTSQICALVKDGAVSDADARALDGLVSSAESAGVPRDLLSIARSVADAGASATHAQVSDLQAKACPP